MHIVRRCMGAGIVGGTRQGEKGAGGIHLGALVLGRRAQLLEHRLREHARELGELAALHQREDLGLACLSPLALCPQFRLCCRCRRLGCEHALAHGALWPKRLEVSHAQLEAALGGVGLAQLCTLLTEPPHQVTVLRRHVALAYAPRPARGLTTTAGHRPR